MSEKTSSYRPHAVVHPAAPGDVRWTGGFWGEWLDVCRYKTVPALWGILSGTDHSQYLQNFRVAAGTAEGRHRGAPFNDGDFYKWLEAACALLLAAGDKGDAELAAWIAESVAAIAAAQREDGYLHTQVLIRQRNGDTNSRPFQNPVDFELYNMGHLMTAACLHHAATGQETLLNVARRAADFLNEAFPEPTAERARFSICPSHYMGLLDLYRVTGEIRYRDLAVRFIEMRDLPPPDGTDDNQDRIPFRQQREAVGHAVRANYLYAGAADLFAETGDHTLWESLEPIWQSVVQRKLYITGGCGALYDGASPDGAVDQKGITRVHQSFGRSYQLPNQTAHNETCAAIGSVLWNWRMFLVTGEARYLDLLELTLYNGVLSGISRDGERFFYNNPLRKLKQQPCELRWPRTRAEYFSSFCCPPNVARILARSAEYAYAVTDNAVLVTLYGGSHLSAHLPDGAQITLTQESRYPQDGHIRLRIDRCEAAPGSPPPAIRLRIPAGAASATVHINGSHVEGIVSQGFLEMRRDWQAGDIIDLDLELPVELVEAHPLVEEARNQITVRRGPLVYCLESPDLPPEISVMDVVLKTGIPLEPRFDPDLLGGVTVLEGQGWATKGHTEFGSELYRTFRPPTVYPVALRLVPYYLWDNRGDSEMTVWMPHEYGAAAPA